MATLGYGSESKQFVTSTTYFWIIPYTTILFTLISLIALLKIATWLIRRYIERMLALSGVAYGEAPYVPQHLRGKTLDTKTVMMRKETYVRATAPVRAGFMEVFRSWQSGTTIQRKFTATIVTLRHYLKPLAAFVFIVVALVLAFYAIKSIGRDATHFEIAINNPGADVVLSSEEIAYNELRVNETFGEEVIDTPPITVVNASGQVGAGARVQIMLEKAGYEVYALETDTTRQDSRTIIVYAPKDQELALTLSRLLTGALLSARDTDDDDRIVIFAGQDSLVR